MSVDLSTTYLDLPLSSPLVASSSPLTATRDGLLRLEDAGAGAVVLPSLFEEQVLHQKFNLDLPPSGGTGGDREASAYLPDLDHYNTGPDHYLELIADAKRSLQIPVIASLNGTSRGGWVQHARLLEEAGADAVELNIYFLATDPTTTSSMVELQYLDLVEAIRGHIQVPLAIKLSPYFNAMAHMADLLVAAGASGLVLFNRFYQPDLDLETRAVTPSLVLSTSDDLRLALRWIATLYRRVHTSLAATGGVLTSVDALKALAVGADVAMMTAALLMHGPDYISRVKREMIEWLEQHDYESVLQVRGSLSYKTVDDPAGVERCDYMKTLTTFSKGLRTPAEGTGP